MPENAQIVETVTALYERLFRPDIDGLRSEIGQIEARLRGEMRVMQADIAALRQTTAAIQSEADDFHRDSDGHFDAVYQRFDRLETEYHMLVEGLRRVERQAATDAAERSAIRAQIRNLENGMADLRSHLGA